LFKAPLIAVYAKRHIVPSIQLVARIFRERARSAIIVRETGHLKPSSMETMYSQKASSGSFHQKQEYTQ